MNRAEVSGQCSVHFSIVVVKMKRSDKYEKRYAEGRFLRLSNPKFVLLFTVILTFVHISGAVPDIPMIVSGSVHINGVPAPAGTVVTAMSGGELKGSTVLMQAGTYGAMVNYTQGLVDFYVNDTKAQSINWSSEPQTLDLNVTISQASQAAATTAATTTALPKVTTTAARYATGGASGATTTVTVTATPKATATTTPAARATDAVKPEDKTASQKKSTLPNETLQKSGAAQSPGFGAIAVIFVVVLISKSIIRRKK
jgi:hypothetical protein